MPADLYYIHDSPPCRAVLLGAKTAGVDLNLKTVDFIGGEHLKPKFRKMNPQHTVPAMDDNGFVLAESRAILRYLVDEYARNDSLYPKDTKKRAMVDQRLDFDIGTLYQRLSDNYFSITISGEEATPFNLKQLEEAFGILEQFLEGQEWVAGSSLTIADIAMVTTVSTAVEFGFSLEQFPNVSRWFEKCKKTIPSYEELSRESLTALTKYVETFRKKYCNMPVDLYYVNVSPPCRAVVLGAKAVGVKLNLKTVDLRAGEHLKPEFIKMNPRHTIPTMDDNGFTLGESRAILGYLADQYAKTDSLYPKDAKKRAVVNQRLNYDIGTLFQAFKDYYCTQMYAGKPANPENFKKLETAFEFLEKFLEGQEWVAGSNMTIADITIVTTVSTAVMNPQHTVPTMNDNGFILAESRAILRYLVDKYAKNDSLYPKDLKKRAKVEEKLDFDVGTLVQGFANYYYAGPAAKPEDITKLEKAFGILEKFLEGQEWVAGSGLTIADIAIVTTVSSAVVLGFSLEKFPNISRWLEKCKKTIPSYEELSNDSLTALKQYFEAPPKK